MVNYFNHFSYSTHRVSRTTVQAMQTICHVGPGFSTYRSFGVNKDCHQQSTSFDTFQPRQRALNTE